MAKKIAPRLADGTPRERLYSGLPPGIKRGLKLIAASRKESVSWMLEKEIARIYGFRVPKYQKKRSVK
jgi:hypothetical protein